MLHVYHLEVVKIFRIIFYIFIFYSTKNMITMKSAIQCSDYTYRYNRVYLRAYNYSQVNRSRVVCNIE